MLVMISEQIKKWQQKTPLSVVLFVSVWLQL
jgi:hypothetical protein